MTIAPLVLDGVSRHAEAADFAALKGSLMPDLSLAVAYFSRRLEFETDVSDVHASLEGGNGAVVIDVRDDAAWDAGHLPGAIHIPRLELTDRAPFELPTDADVVVYCWSPGCNGATKAALALSLAGYRVREMLGGFEYWVREGFAVASADGSLTHPAVDPLTAVGVVCAC
jgi:rhodanese-related sulfurtransferase